MDKNIIILATIFIGLALFVIIFRKRTPLKYVKNNVLTENEKEFFNRLKKAFPEHIILSQVSMGAVIKPEQPRNKTRREFSEYRIKLNKVLQKRIDFVILDESLETLYVIELDDKTHIRKRDKDKERDSFLLSAGIKTIRYESRNKPSIEKLKQDLDAIKKMNENSENKNNYSIENKPKLS